MLGTLVKNQNEGQAEKKGFDDNQEVKVWARTVHLSAEKCVSLYRVQHLSLRFNYYCLIINKITSILNPCLIWFQTEFQVNMMFCEWV